MTLATALRRRLPWFLRRGGNCSHLDAVRDVSPSADGCEECLKTGDAWVHLRMCLVCGEVGCCDQSKNKHATAHFHETAHPLVQSREPGETWRWCYVDQVMLTR
ncbi:ubiquitin carboxyl-terminal hydrolase 14 [Blastococcus sp. VKM Ac-2987]|uniref:ubiquitin carboxyl-terminal hydrolase 14 n=1 Tax=Blastococcus sp. VKM Ac-2987 TaxID=3004141 RepID=UPI0022AB664D|nr:UBP-type zinc finger domain-containing protein [Blastococcus sp. VKM Ac-2987]MCZ2860839.1 UBP-type zinc finger domain-containing protein [Blastococcus sp. VKM Ac-2987]